MTNSPYTKPLRASALAAALAMCFGNAAYAADPGRPTGATPRVESSKPTSATRR